MDSRLLINEPPLQVLPSLAQIIGVNGAMVLQQVHYWLNPRFNKNVFEGRHWVHNTFAQWQDQFSFWSPKTIKRIIGDLEESGLLISFVTRSFKKTKYYAVNYELLNRLCSKDVAQAVFITLPPTGTVWTEGNPKSELNATEHQSFLSVQNTEDSPSGQSDPLGGDILALSIGSICPSRWGQLDPIDGVNVTPFHYTENSPETTQENSSSSSCPPPSARSFCDSRQEEEEEQNKIRVKNSNSSFNPSPIPNSNLDPSISEQMIEFWNQIVQRKIYSGQDVRLSETRQHRLKGFLETVVGNKPPSEQLDFWQAYCTTIASSKFLAGQNSTGFRATLDWALIPDNANKVLEGAIYDKPELSKIQGNLSWEEFSEELVRTLPSNPHLQAWINISINLAKLIGQVKYRSWFLKVSLKELTQTTAIFSVEDGFTRDYIVSHFTSEIRCAIQALYPQVRIIDFQVLLPTGGA